MLGQQARQELFTTHAEWFAANHIQLRTGRRATHLDTARRAIGLDSGEEVSFDKLLIATGASPKHLKIPGADLPNVFYLRTIEDADRLRHAIDKAKAEGHPHARGRGRAVIIGGGVLGVELAAAFTQVGLHADLVMSRCHPWDRFVGETVGRFLMRYLQSQGHPGACGPPARPSGKAMGEFSA